METQPLGRIRRIGFQTIVRREFGRIIRILGQTLVPPAVTAALYSLIFGSFIGRRIGQAQDSFFASRERGVVEARAAIQTAPHRALVELSNREAGKPAPYSSEPGKRKGGRRKKGGEESAEKGSGDKGAGSGEPAAEKKAKRGP